MKKFVVTLFVLVSLVVTMFPTITTHASIQKVECSWWGKMIHGEYGHDDNGDDTCSWCNGSGDCQTCDGKGYVYKYKRGAVECEDCDGTGKCSHCNGWGR